jgi:hypothetical protein
MKAIPRERENSQRGDVEEVRERLSLMSRLRRDKEEEDDVVEERESVEEEEVLTKRGAMEAVK